MKQAVSTAVESGQGIVEGRSFSPQQLALLKKVCAAGNLTNLEFDLFIETAKHLVLDPFKKQIVPIVFNANDAKKRRVEHVVTQQGYRSRAVGSGTWGPWVDEEAMREGREPAPNPQIFFSEDLVDPQTNPLGLNYAVYYCKRYRRPGSDNFDIVMGKARWVERVPLKTVWRDQKPTDERYIGSPQWRPGEGQPAHMLGKCAECDALRRGWPDEMSGFYGEEEMQRAIADEEYRASAAELADQYDTDEKMKRSGRAGTILFTWNPGDPMTPVPIGELADGCVEWLSKATKPLEVQKFEERNAAALQQLFLISKVDGVGVREAIDARLKELNIIDVDETGEPTEDRGPESAESHPDDKTRLV